MKLLNPLLILFTVALLFTSCGNKSDARSELMKCNKEWSDRTEYEKIIGKWCGEKKGDEYFLQPFLEEAVTKYIGVICFYSDNTMKEFQRSDDFYQEETEMDSGTNVQVNDGILTFVSANYGKQSYSISVSETSLTIDGKIASVVSDSYSKCN